MAYGLTSEQVQQIVNNTVLVMLARPDLMPEWHGNLFALMQQASEASLDDEMVFVGAVLTLLDAPNDDLPTGTMYDHAWDAILVSLQTGVAQPAQEEDSAITLNRLLQSIAEAAVAVMTRLPEQRDAVVEELHEIRTAAINANGDELRLWLDDILKLLDGEPLESLGKGHQDLYATCWASVVRGLSE